MTKSLTRAGLVLALLLVLAAAFALAPSKKVEYTNVDLLADIPQGDKKAHKDFASDVFAAKVERSVGNNPRYTVLPSDAPEGEKPIALPHEQFEVTLTENVKGKLRAGDTVKVEQAGGPNGEGQVELHEETPRLEAGKEYLLLVRYDKERGTYNVIAQPAGIVELGKDKDKILKEYKGL